MSYKLINGIERHNESPETFEIPSAGEIQSLHEGSLVKLGFEEDGSGAERMWVEVKSIQDNVLEGVLDNDPTLIQSIKAGDSLSFRNENILAIWHENQ